MKKEAQKHFTHKTHKVSIPHLIPVERLHDMAVMLAEQAAMEGSVRLLPHGTRMYDIAEGWESRQLKGVSAVCGTIGSLEKAMRDPGITHIFMEKAALITDKDIAKVAQRNAVPKLLFREVGAP